MDNFKRGMFDKMVKKSSRKYKPTKSVENLAHSKALGIFTKTTFAV
jgi:hypothetical protein